MALLKTGSYKNTGTVYLDYRLHADQIGGSGNNRTIRITVEFKCGGNPSYPSWYGYPCYWQPYVNSTYGSTGTMKGSESWNTNNGYRSYSQDITVNIGTTSATNVTVGFVTNSTGDDGWDGGASASFGVSSTNTAPWFQAVDKVTADGTTGAKYIPENQSVINVSWPTAYDTDGNLAGYRVRLSINGGGYSEVTRMDKAYRAHNHNVSGYGAGTSFQYCIDAYDSMSVWSGNIFSGVITKNSLTPATLTAPGSIVWDTKTLSFSWSGAANKVSNTSFTYELSCKQLTIYGGISTGNSMTIPIVDSKPDSGPYILKSDLINAVKDSAYKGTLTFTLKTSNAYGSTGSNSKSTSVNLQSPPATPKPVISTEDDSPDSLNIWRTVADTKNRYMIPDGVRRIRVSWSAVVGNVGEAITYDMFYRLDGGGYISVGNQSGTTYNLVLPTVDKMTTINFMVRAKSSYGLVSGDGVSLGYNLHYYRSPYLVIGKLNRTETAATLEARVKTESSIPNINTKGTYVNTTLGGTPVALPLSQASFATLNFAGLTGDSSYIITFVYNDGTGFTTSDVTETFKIGANLPSVFINKYGLGIGGAVANINNSLVMNGSSYVSGSISAGGTINAQGSITSTGNIIGMNGIVTSYGLKGADAEFLLDRGTTGNAWKILNNQGMLRIQGGFNGGTSGFQDVMSMDLNSGDVKITKGNMSLGVNDRYIYGTDLSKTVRKMIGMQNNALIIGDKSKKHDQVQIYGTKLQFNEVDVKIDNYHIPTLTGISNTTTAYIAIPNVYYNDSCGQYLLNFEYNHHYQGSSIYWSSRTMLIGISTVWDGSRVVNRATLTNLGHSGSDSGGWNLIWEAPWSKDKAAGSSSRLVLLFTKNADNTDVDKIIRDIKLIKLANL